MDLQTVVVSITGLGTAAAMLTRYVIALVQLSADLPEWVPGATALGIGIATAGLFTAAQGAPWTGAQVAVVILAGVLAAAEAEGLAAAQSAAHRESDYRMARAEQEAERVALNKFHGQR